MRPRLRDILLVAGACAVVVPTGACSSPATDALSRTSGDSTLSNSLSAPGTPFLPGGGELKARVIQTPKEPLVDETKGPCPASMASIDGRFCIDRYEAALVDVLSNGEERAHSPFTPVDAQQRVRAVSSANVFPQGYISSVEAKRACTASGKRLCRVAEWGKACRGPDARSYGYADRREPGRCNDTGRNPVLRLYGRNFTWTTMNQPQLNQLDNTLSKTGEHSGCTNDYGVYDMVGNLHEWVADASGTFCGGYYQDVASVGHGEGCGYRTTAHEARYHDYSTGFRCCADVAGVASDPSPPAQPPRKRSKR